MIVARPRPSRGPEAGAMLAQAALPSVISSRGAWEARCPGDTLARHSASITPAVPRRVS